MEASGAFTGCIAPRQISEKLPSPYISPSEVGRCVDELHTGRDQGDPRAQRPLPTSRTSPLHQWSVAGQQRCIPRQGWGRLLDGWSQVVNVLAARCACEYICVTSSNSTLSM